MVNEMDEENVRTPVRVGTLRSTHMSKGGEARALRFDAAATEGEERLGKASMTPPRALRMTVMSPGRRSEAAVRLSESVRESSSRWAVAMPSRADEDARRDAEAERERLRARVVTMERDAEAAAVEKQMWLNERVRLGASASAAEENENRRGASPRRRSRLQVTVKGTRETRWTSVNASEPRSPSRDETTRRLFRRRSSNRRSGCPRWSCRFESTS